jgi:hypothetical protein
MFGETIPLVDHPAQNQSDYYPTNAKAGEIYEKVGLVHKHSVEIRNISSMIMMPVSEYHLQRFRGDFPDDLVQRVTFRSGVYQQGFFVFPQ